MAYGIQINTMLGTRTIADERIPKFIASVPVSGSGLPGTGGSFTAPGGVTSSTGFAFTTNPTIQVSMSGSTVSWSFVIRTSLTTANIIIVKFL